MRNVGVSQAVFAATMIVLGVVGLFDPAFTVIWQPVPAGATHQALLYLSAFVSIACGAGLLWPRTAATSARVLLAYLLLWLVAFRLPGLFHSLGVDIYWAASRTAVMAAAAWVLYVWLAGDWDRRHLRVVTGDSGLRIARALYGLAIIPFGIAHFQFVPHTAELIPGWLPAHVAWVYVTGSAFVLAGVAILVGVFARLAAALSALQMGLFLLLVWVPVVAAGSMSTFNRSETVITWALAVAGWVVTESYRKT